MKQDFVKLTLIIIGWLIFISFFIWGTMFYSNNALGADFFVGNGFPFTTKATAIVENNLQISTTTKELWVNTNWNTIIINTSAVHIFINNKIIK